MLSKTPFLTAVLFFLLPLSSSAAIITTSELGWRANQDVSQQFASFVTSGQLKAGDTLILSENYQIQGRTQIKLPENVTIAGAFFGAGLTVRNTEPETRNGVLQLNNGNTLINFSIEYKETLPVPPLSEGITSNGKSNTRGIVAFADNLRVINCFFKGNVGIHVDVSGENLQLKDSHFDGGSTHVRWLADNRNHLVDNTLFENALADGIKTVRGGESGTTNASVLNSVFLNNRRDGIDTTGGFEDSTVIGSYFVNLFKGLDLKNIFDNQTSALGRAGINKNILVTDSVFVNVKNAIAAITLDRGNSGGTKWISNANADQFLTQRIRLENSTIEASSGREARAVLAQDVHTLNWQNITLFGAASEVKIGRNPAQSSAVSTNVTTNYNISGSGTQRQAERAAKPDSFYRSLAGPDTSLRFGANNSSFIPSIFLLLNDD